MSELEQMKRKRIAQLNDSFRTTMIGGCVMLTAGVDALPSDAKAMLIRKVATFDDFDKVRNDPYGEHDFGSIDLAGQKFFWQIACYQKGSDFMDGAETPENAATTDRVLTIMQAEEY